MLRTRLRREDADVRTLGKLLVAAASKAWVFGWMGSWNDMGFEDKAEQQEYDEVSRELSR
jgi:hypothetical protein